MIGRRIGWSVAPAPLINGIARVHMYNVVTPTGIAQAGAIAALLSDEPGRDAALRAWQRRRDEVSIQLGDYDMIPRTGGGSQRLNVAALGINSFEASRRF